MEISEIQEDVPEIILDLPTIKADINRVLKETSERGLLQTSKWLAEINHSIRLEDTGATQPIKTDKVLSLSLPQDGPDLDTYILAKTYFDLKEYDRSAFSLNLSLFIKVVFLIFTAGTFRVRRSVWMT